jgi:DNA-directed RNA polymerase specialized sigma24 family protein
MNGEITEAVQRWRQGDADAQFDLERWLHPFLLHLMDRVHQRVAGTALQARIDSEGVVYAALHSFLTGVRKDEFPELACRDDVKKILTILVSRTLSDAVRWNSRQRRSPAREVACDEGIPPQAVTAPAVVELEDDLAAWMEKMIGVLRRHDERAISIVRLSLEGLSNTDIAEELGLGIRRVQILKQQLKDRWDQALCEDT